MANSQPRWSIHEAAILLDGYLETVIQQIPRSCIVKRVSAALRRMAINSGKTIDDIYRNENGISFQIRRMESAYCGRTVMEPATQLFTEIVALYNEHREEYERLLKKARDMMQIQNNYEQNNNLYDSDSTTVASADASAVSTHPAPYPTDVKVQDDWIKYDFTNSQDFERTKPVYCSVAGIPVVGKNWGQILGSISERELEKRNPAMDELYKVPLFKARKDRPYLMCKRLEGCSCFQLKNRYYVCTNYSSPRLMEIIRALCLKCGYKDEEIILYGVKKDTLHSARIIEKNSTASKHVRIEKADERYRNVLIQNFPKGFRLDSPLDLRRFQRFYEQINGTVLDDDIELRKIQHFYEQINGSALDDDIELRKFQRFYEQINGTVLDDDNAVILFNIYNCGILFEGKVFVPEIMLGDDIRERLFTYIKKSFDEGKTALYYEAIFNEFSEDFLDYFIYNADMLKEYLSYFLDADYCFSRSYMSPNTDTTANPTDEIRICLKRYASPMTYDMIFEKLPHIPHQKIKQILAANNEFVSNARGEYFHISAMHLSDEELDNIAEIITMAINDKHFLSGNELIDAIKSKYPKTYQKTCLFTMVGVRDAIKYHLCSKFSFSGNIISNKESCLTMSGVFADYCRNRNSFTIDELNVLANELGTGIYFNSVYENSLRISHDRFVAKTHAQFLIPETDTILDLLCTGDYIPIGKTISGFGLFPNAGFPWNEYLLESYVAAYSDKYCLLHTGFNMNKCAGAIAKKTAGFKDFNDCIATVLADSDITLKQQQALQYLYNEGYIASHRLSNIEELLIRATAQRNRKEAN